MLVITIDISFDDKHEEIFHGHEDIKFCFTSFNDYLQDFILHSRIFFPYRIILFAWVNNSNNPGLGHTQEGNK